MIATCSPAARSPARRASFHRANCRCRDGPGSTRTVPLRPPIPIPGPSTAICGRREHGADRHRHADRFLRQGRLRRHDGLRPLAHRARRSSRSARARGHAGARASRSSTPAKAIGPTSPICPPTSAGARAASARASATRGRAAASWCAASRAGRSSPSSRRSPGETDHRQARQGLVLRHRPRADPAHPRHPQPRADRHHHRRVRAHDHARGQRPRLRVPAARGLRAAPPTTGNHLAAIKMVKMQGGVFGAVADSGARLIEAHHGEL